MFDVIKEMLISEKEFTETNYKRLQKTLFYMESNLIDSDGGMYLTVYSLTEINNIITGSIYVTLRKVIVKPYLIKFDKMYMDKELIEEQLCQTIDQFHERKTTSAKFYSILLNKIHPFYDGNGRTCKILFANDLNYI